MVSLAGIAVNILIAVVVSVINKSFDRLWSFHTGKYSNGHYRTDLPSALQHDLLKCGVGGFQSSAVPAARRKQGSAIVFAR